MYLWSIYSCSTFLQVVYIVPGRAIGSSPGTTEQRQQNYRPNFVSWKDQISNRLINTTNETWILLLHAGKKKPRYACGFKHNAVVSSVIAFRESCLTSLIEGPPATTASSELPPVVRLAPSSAAAANRLVVRRAAPATPTVATCAGAALSATASMQRSGIGRASGVLCRRLCERCHDRLAVRGTHKKQSMRACTLSVRACTLFQIEIWFCRVGSAGIFCVGGLSLRGLFQILNGFCRVGSPGVFLLAGSIPFWQYWQTPRRRSKVVRCAASCLPHHRHLHYRPSMTTLM